MDNGLVVKATPVTLAPLTMIFRGSETAASLGIDQLIALGKGAAAIASAAQASGLTNCRVVASAAEAAELLDGATHAGDLVLVKGSRAARTEQVLEKFSQMETRCAS